MKVEMRIDCSPEEFRRLLGLPDVSALNRHLEAAIEKAAAKAMPDADEMAGWMRAWMAQAGEAQTAMAQWLKLFQGSGRRGDD